MLKRRRQLPLVQFITWPDDISTDGEAVRLKAERGALPKLVAGRSLSVTKDMKDATEVQFPHGHYRC